LQAPEGSSIPANKTPSPMRSLTGFI
jgi:hypothetical protein